MLKTFTTGTTHLASPINNDWINGVSESEQLNFVNRYYNRRTSTGRPNTTIFAVNSDIFEVAPTESVEVFIGDILTFRLRYNLPSTDFRDMVVASYSLPPYYDVNALNKT